MGQHLDRLMRLLLLRWWWRTLLIFIAIGVMVRLGVWQLDRLEQRRALNATIREQLSLPPVSINDAWPDVDVQALRYRRIVARGEFDFEHQFTLTNQRRDGDIGIHLITPLRLEGREEAILVDRGWLPQRFSDPALWSQFDIPGPVTVIGYMGLRGLPPRGRSVSPPDAETRTAYYIDPEAVQTQVAYPLLPFYLEWTEGRDQELPYPPSREFDLSDGPHLGYAIQWFAFALIFALGYGYWVYRAARGST